MIQGFTYFPTIIYRDEKPEFVSDLTRVSQKYFQQQNKQEFFCQTISMENDVEVEELKNYLLTSGFHILTSQGYSMEKYELILSGLWAQEIKNYGGTDIHLHKNSQLSGWFFLETPKNGSYPIFYDTRMNKRMIELDYVQTEDITNATSSVHFNNLNPGTVLFANSWMTHQLTANFSDTSTKTIHFIISHKDKLCNTL
jgi:uncharacterized protein (TIGR02466 family)